MKERISKLIDVKSIVTLALVAVLCVITLMGIDVPELFSSSVMLVLGFFFGKNVQSSSTMDESSTKPIVKAEEKSDV